MKRKYEIVNKQDQFQTWVGISPESISKNMEILETDLAEAQSYTTNQVPIEIQFYLLQAIEMLNFARDNISKQFYHVADSSMLLAKRYLDRYYGLVAN